MRVRSIAIALLLTAACGSKDPSRPAPAPPPPQAAPPDAHAYRPGAPAERPPPPPRPSDAEFAAMMNQAMAMFAAMAKAVDHAGDDCGALADAFNQIIDDNRDFIDAAKAYKDDAEMDKKAEEWMKGNMEAMLPAMMKIGAAGQRCDADAKFIEAMKRMDDLK